MGYKHNPSQEPQSLDANLHVSTPALAGTAVVGAYVIFCTVFSPP